MIGFYYLYVQKPFKIYGMAKTFQVGENLYIVVPMEKKVIVTQKDRVFVYDGEKWIEK